MDRTLVDALVRKQCLNRLYQLYESKRAGNVISLQRDAYHMFIDLPEFSLQLGVFVHENSALSSLFLSPQAISPANREAFIHLANEANVAEVGYGRFVVDKNDFAYLTWVPEWMIANHPEEARYALFVEGVSRFSQIKTAIVGVSYEGWPADKAKRYIYELYTEGFVCDDEFE